MGAGGAAGRPTPADPPNGMHARETDALTVTKRLQREGRWFGQAEQTRDDLFQQAKAKGSAYRSKSKEERQQWVYSELDRMYPPVQQKPPLSPPHTSSNDGVSSAVVGLSDIPAGWEKLPNNASLAAEIGWVQANRLAVVEERASGGTVVHLDRARSPAPSWASLGWLETSIRSYAKFVDVAARASASDDDEAGHVRRERTAIEEIRAVLREMHDDEAR